MKLQLDYPKEIHDRTLSSTSENITKQNKTKALKPESKKWHLTYKEKTGRMTVDFTSEMVRAKGRFWKYYSFQILEI